MRPTDPTALPVRSTPARAAGRQVVLASGNPGKLREIQAILDDVDIDLIPQSRFKVTEAIESGLSFVENALIKARHAGVACGLPTIADDSGIEVDVLDGRPGIYSARYAGEGVRDEIHLQKLLRETEGVPESQRSCRFHCVMVYMRHPEDPTPIICHGVWEGRLLTEPVGENGFGYDPIFYVRSEGCSSAQLSPQRKNHLSHRGQALRQLVKRLADKGCGR